MSNLMAARRERVGFQRETALELADTERDIWQDSWIELNVHLERLDARLASGGVPQELIQGLRDVSVLCWRDRQEGVKSGSSRPAIGVILLEARRLVSRVCVAYLLGNEGKAIRREMSDTALQKCRDIAEDPDYNKLRDAGTLRPLNKR